MGLDENYLNEIRKLVEWNKALREEKAHTDMACEQFLKQLKAKEQECEELKNKNKFMEEYIQTVENARDELEHKLNLIKEEDIIFTLDTKKLIAQYSAKLEQLKAENGELKGKINQLTILGMDLNQNNEVLRKSFLTADRNKDNWREKAEKYCKTITEIKEIANYSFNLSTSALMAKLEQILQKINECEVENDRL